MHWRRSRRTAAGQDVVVAQQLANKRQQDADADAGTRYYQCDCPIGQVLHRTQGAVDLEPDGCGNCTLHAVGSLSVLQTM